MRLHRAMLLAAGLFSLACADTPTTPPPTTGMAAVGGVDPSNIIVVLPESKTFGIGAGNAHTCAVTFALTLRCWGSNSLGQAPQRFGPPEHFLYAQVSAGTGDNTCALRFDFAAECIGKNDIGQSPGIVNSSEESIFLQVDAGRDHACAVNFNFNIECWGGTNPDYAPPLASADVGGFVQVSAGDETTCGLRTDGQIECGGVPGIPDGFSIAPYRMKRMSAGKHFVCAIHGDATKISCRGANGAGQAPFMRTAGASRYVDVSAGELHACALRKDGIVECWGENIQGQAPATRAAAVGRFIMMSAGAFHTCAVRTDFQAECWGQNTNGQTNAPPLKNVFKFRGFRSQQITQPPGSGLLNHVVLFSGGGNMNLKFSLGSNEGLGVIAAGYPKVAQINCGAPENLDTGPSTTGVLSYNASADEYNYAWAIPGALTRSCQQFIMKFTDGMYYKVNFRFTGPPAAIIKIEGGTPTVGAGNSVEPGFILRLVDQFGFGIAARQVTFAVIEGGGNVSAPSAMTSPEGFVVVPTWTAGPPGPQKLRATVVAVAGTFTFDMVTDAVP